jgi:hypothetical protein
MRRKSSAQNLLSSFKSNSSQSQSSAVMSPVVSTPVTALYTPLSGSSTPLTREWDAQSLQSEAISLSSNAVHPNTNGGQMVQGTSVEYLRDLVQKRMITITYMRNVHEGCVVVSLPLVLAVFK